MVTIRRAVADDLPRCRAVWLATESVDDADDATVFPLHAHELTAGTLLVAEAGDTGIIGFGATLARSGITYLADLFVHPDEQGHGIGSALLHALFDDHDGPRFTMASGSPSARALYARFGMAPAWELSYLLADVSDLDTGSLDPSGITAHDATVDDVAPIDHAVTRRDRRADLEHETVHLGGRLLALRRGDALAGYAVVIHPTWWILWRPHGTRVAPVVVRDADDAPAAVAAALHAAIGRGATLINTFVPVPHPAHDALLAAGFRRTDADLHMTSRPDLLDPIRYLPSIDTC